MATATAGKAPSESLLAAREAAVLLRSIATSEKGARAQFGINVQELATKVASLKPNHPQTRIAKELIAEASSILAGKGFATKVDKGLPPSYGNADAIERGLNTALRAAVMSKSSTAINAHIKNVALPQIQALSALIETSKQATDAASKKFGAQLVVKQANLQARYGIIFHLTTNKALAATPKGIVLAQPEEPITPPEPKTETAKTCSKVNKLMIGGAIAAAAAVTIGVASWYFGINPVTKMTSLAVVARDGIATFFTAMSNSLFSKAATNSTAV